ncbi:MAG: hypothetical protein DRP50_00090 [Thermotoga sp.]|nr:MAG: hypothetical protein DRP50_00090 [Thermotoga sp.]
MEKFAMGVDIGGTNIRAGVVEDNGEILKRYEEKINKDGAYQISEQICDLIERFNLTDILGIGIAIPGVVKPSGNVWAPNLSGWEDFPLRRILLQRFHKIPIFIENDRNAMLIGEKWLGLAKGYKNIVFLIIGTGIGAGLMVDGKIYSGSEGIAGSVGWLVTDRHYLPEYKKIGCFEYRAGGPSIARRVTFDPLLVSSRAEIGNSDALKIIEELGEEIGIGIADIVSILNPEIIVIGGGIANLWKFLETQVKVTLEKWAHPLAMKNLRVVPSSLGNDGGILGTAKIVFEGVR